MDEVELNRRRARLTELWTPSLALGCCQICLPYTVFLILRGSWDMQE